MTSPRSPRQAWRADYSTARRLARVLDACERVECPAPLRELLCDAAIAGAFLRIVHPPSPVGVCPDCGGQYFRNGLPYLELATPQRRPSSPAPPAVACLAPVDHYGSTLRPNWFQPGRWAWCCWLAIVMLPTDDARQCACGNGIPF